MVKSDWPERESSADPIAASIARALDTNGTGCATRRENLEKPMAIAQRDCNRKISIRDTQADTDARGGRPFARHATRSRADIKAVVCTEQILGKACFLRDLSTSGARLEYTGGIAPTLRRFVLYIPSCRISLNCRQVWQSGRMIGIEFERGRPGHPAVMDALLPLAA